MTKQAKVSRERVKRFHKKDGDQKEGTMTVVGNCYVLGLIFVDCRKVTNEFSRVVRSEISYTFHRKFPDLLCPYTTCTFLHLIFFHSTIFPPLTRDLMGFDEPFIQRCRSSGREGLQT